MKDVFDVDAYLADTNNQDNASNGAPPARTEGVAIAQPSRGQDAFDVDAYIGSGAQPGAGDADFSVDKYLSGDYDTEITGGRLLKSLAGGIATGALDAGIGLIKAQQTIGDVAPHTPAGFVSKLYNRLGVYDAIAGALRDYKDGAVADAYRVPEDYSKRLPAQLAQGLGSMVPMIASGPASLATGILQSGGSAYEEAIKGGASENTARTSGFIMGAVTGISEKFLGVVPKIAKRMGLSTQTTVGLVEKIASAIKSAGGEATQEAIEQVANNVVAKYGWDEKRGVFDGVGRAALVGGILGGGVDVVMSGPTSKQAAALEEQKTRDAFAGQIVKDLRDKYGITDEEELGKIAYAAQQVDSPEKADKLRAGIARMLESRGWVSHDYTAPGQPAASPQRNAAEPVGSPATTIEAAAPAPATSSTSATAQPADPVSPAEPAPAATPTPLTISRPSEPQQGQAKQSFKVGDVIEAPGVFAKADQYFVIESFNRDGTANVYTPGTGRTMTVSLDKPYESNFGRNQTYWTKSQEESIPDWVRENQRVVSAAQAGQQVQLPPDEQAQPASDQAVQGAPNSQDAVAAAQQASSPAQDAGATTEPVSTGSNEQSGSNARVTSNSDGVSIEAGATQNTMEQNRQSVRQQLDMVRPLAPGAEIVSVSNVDQLPDDVRKRVQDQGGGSAEAFYDRRTGQIFVLEDNISPERVGVVVLQHEALHRGVAVLEQKMGAETFATMLDQVFSGMSESAKANLTKNGYDPNNTRVFAEEHLAALAENPDVDPGLWSKTVATVRQALRRAGFVNSMTDNDIRVLIYNALNSGRGNRAYIDKDGQVRFARAEHGTRHTLAPEPGFPNGRFRLDLINSKSSRGLSEQGWGIYFNSGGDVATRFKEGGNLYSVDIPDNLMPNIMNWRAPLSSGHKDAIGNHIFSKYGIRLKSNELETGLDAYEAVREIIAPRAVDKSRIREFTSKEFLGAGIIGSRQQLSMRGGGENIVVWDQGALDQVSMLERNGENMLAAQGGDLRMSRQQKASPTFYSAVERTIEQSKQQKAPGAQWISWLKGQPGIKQEELDWLGVDEWLKSQDKPVTKQQLQEFVAANKVEVREVVLGNNQQRAAQVFQNYTDQELGDHLIANMGADPDEVANMSRADMLNYADQNADVDYELADGAVQTKFDRYTLPGGKNYRELLLTLPVKQKPTAGRIEKLPNGRWRVDEPGGTVKLLDTEAEAVALTERLGEMFGANQNQFRSPHFSDPNVLAHVRFNERTDADGKRVLFVEEVQSDWHQQGRDKGYASKINTSGWRAIAFRDSVKGVANGRKDWNVFDANGNRVATSITARSEPDAIWFAVAAKANDGVPNAPFKTSWPMLAMKRMIRWASENGFDRIAWTTGEQQAERYDLSKQVRSVWAAKKDDGMWEVRVMPNGRNADWVHTGSHEASKLAEVVGKDLADKIVNEQGQNGMYRGQMFHGVDLKVGGEGMRAFYDQILPSEVNKYAKKWGGKVGSTSLDGSNRSGVIDGDKVYFTVNGVDITDPLKDIQHGQPISPSKAVDYWVQLGAKRSVAQSAIDEATSGSTIVHSLDITPAMREAAMGGQVMFSMRARNVGKDELITINKNLERAPSKLANHLVSFVDPDRLRKLRVDVIDKISAVYNSFPTVKELKTLAEMGRAGRRWYQLANRVINNLAQNEEDAWRLSGVLAATSPNKGVPDSVAITLGVWKRWNDAGRPTDPAQLQKLLYRFWSADGTMAASKQTASEVIQNNPIYLPADLGNTIAALTSPDYQTALQNFSDSSPKVKPFFRAIMGELDAVVNDTWMARIFGLPKTRIGQVAENTVSTIMTKAVAKELGWEPAEVQAALWAVARVFGERINVALSKKDGRPRLSELFSQEINDDMLMPGDDLATLLVKGYKTKGGKEYDFSKQVKDLGFNLERGLAEYDRAGVELIERGSRHDAGKILGPSGIRSVGRRLESGYRSEREAEALRFSTRKQQTASSDVDQILADMGIAIPDGKKIRGLQARLITAAGGPGDPNKIAQSEKTYYEQQNLQQAKDTVDAMSPQEVRSVALQLGSDPLKDGFSNVGVLATIRVINEEHAAGRDVTPLIDKLGSVGTAMGQLIRQFAELKTNSPVVLLEIIKRKMADQNRYLRQDQEARMQGLIDSDFKARKLFNDASRDYAKSPTPNKLESLAKLEQDAQAASNGLMLYAGRMMPRSGSNMFAQLIQGNLLVPISHARNIGSNIMMQGIRDIEQAQAAIGDAVLSYISGSPRTIGMPSISGRIVGAARGTARGVRELFTGSAPEERVHGEYSIKGFHPIEAWKAVLDPKNLPVTKDGKVSPVDYFKAIVEATLGIPAEINFRLLGLGDHPFRQSTYESVVREQANIRNVKGDARKMFIARPPADVIELALKESIESVYQGKSQTVSQLQGLLNLENRIGAIGGWINAIFIKPVAPYIQTPINVAHIAIQLASPEYSAARTIWYGAKAATAKTESERIYNRRKSLQSAGRTAMSITLCSAAAALVRAGLVSGGDDDEKRSELGYALGFPKNSINISGLARLLNGEDPAWRPGDTTHSLLWYGFLGLNASIAARNKSDAEKSGKKWDDRVLFRVPPIAQLASSMVEMTVLKGASDVLTAVSNGEYDRLEQQYMRSLVSVAAPNTLTSINRAQRKYMPDYKGYEQVDVLKAIVGERNPFITANSQYPYKRDPLGNPVEQTPDGAHPWMYNVFDPTKSRTMTQDPMWVEIGRLYRSTKDTDAIPGAPGRQIKYPGSSEPTELKPFEYERMLEFIGNDRKIAINNLISRRDWSAIPDLTKVIYMKRAYDMGAASGRKKYVAERFNFYRGGQPDGAYDEAIRSMRMRVGD